MAAGSNLHISISAEPVFTIGGVTITNSIFTTWIVTALIVAASLAVFRQVKDVRFDQKPNRTQSLVEMIIEGLYNLVKGIAGSNQKARSFFPLVGTFFLFIILSNWFGLLPGVGTIGYQHQVEAVDTHADEATHADESGSAKALEADHGASAAETLEPVDSTHQAETQHAAEVATHQPEAMAEATDHQVETVEHGEEAETHHTSFVPYFRGPTADLNTTLALAIFSMASVQVVGFKYLNLGYMKKFINFASPIDFFVGILELMSEFSKVVSFAFRLFGNIFAGEVLLVVIAFLVPLFAPLPFLGLEIFVGFIQALVFAMLTLVFLNMATISHAHDDH